MTATAAVVLAKRHFSNCRQQAYRYTHTYRNSDDLNLERLPKEAVFFVVFSSFQGDAAKESIALWGTIHRSVK